MASYAAYEDQTKVTSFAVYEEKARKAFHFFDLDKNGLVTRDEFVKVADTISSLSKCSASEAATTRYQWTKWADALFPEGSINEGEFVRRGKKLLMDCPEEFHQADADSYADMFKCLDRNKDRYIYQDELELYYKAFGYNNIDYIKKVFKALDENGDNLISQDEFVNAFVVYWSNQPGYDFLYSPS